MLYRTNVALQIRGDRVEKGTEIELSREEARVFDPADITALADIPAPEEEAVEPVPLEEMTLAQLKERAKELGLSASGSKADIDERIRLHLEGAPAPEEEAVEEEELSESNQ